MHVNNIIKNNFKIRERNNLAQVKIARANSFPRNKSVNEDRSCQNMKL